LGISVRVSSSACINPRFFLTLVGRPSFSRFTTSLVFARICRHLWTRSTLVVLTNFGHSYTLVWSSSHIEYRQAGALCHIKDKNAEQGLMKVRIEMQMYSESSES